MGFIDFIFDILSYPTVVVGICLGILVASIAWYFLPETIDRASIGAWAIAVGSLGGLLLSYAGKSKK